MIGLFEAAWEIHRFLNRHKIPYAIIGGFAVQYWGIPRLTVDVDLTVLTPLEEGTDNFVRLILTRFHSRAPDPYELARQARLVVVQASNGSGLDISFGMPGYWDELMRRARDYELEPGKAVRLCSAEDLIIHKCIAGRPQDLRDIDGVVARQSKGLDETYIRKWLAIFAKELADSEVRDRFERAWRAEKRAAREARQVYRIRRG
ncbi:MAG: nucleotidyl transferase AbiEii/AbiGii toxin family protein [Chloroflexi bacterium]|nr:nucleotidyl transferase AbiEii/AbiGii toxin family protein [Chloroflexota bacterium]